MLPVLHCQNIGLIDHEQLDAAQEVRSAAFCAFLLLLDAHPEPKWTGKNDVRLIKFGKALQCGPGQLETDAERIVDVALESRDVVGGVPRGGVRRSKLVCRARREGELVDEALAVFDVGGEREVGEVVEPGQGRVAERKEDEHFGTGEALVARFTGVVSQRGLFLSLSQVLVVPEHSVARSVTATPPTDECDSEYDGESLRTW